MNGLAQNIEGVDGDFFNKRFVFKDLNQAIPLIKACYKRSRVRINVLCGLIIIPIIKVLARKLARTLIGITHEKTYHYETLKNVYPYSISFLIRSHFAQTLNKS